MMNLNKPVKIFLGIVSCIPFLYLIFFFGFIAFTFMSTFSNPSVSKTVFNFFPVIFVLHMSMILLMFALIVFYIVYLFQTDRVGQDKKVLWAVILFLGGMIAMPIFWYLYVWKPADTLPSN